MESTYNLQSTPKGYVLIINNETFTEGDYEKREGSERDYDDLKCLFRGLGFKCRSYYNLNYKDFTKVVRSFALMDDHWKVDCSILFIMTHGHKDRVNPHAVDLATTDNKFVSTDWIKEKFNSENCKPLMNKPKIMFFQACRDNGHSQMLVKRPKRLHAQDGAQPHISDLLVIHSCLPGYGAHRNSKYGAWFVQELCSVIQQESSNMHLISILNKVDMNLRQRFVKENGSCFQAVYFENWSFNKLLFLSDEAQGFHRAVTTMLEMSNKKRKLRKKPPASKPLMITKGEVKKALTGVIDNEAIMELRRKELEDIPQEERKIAYLMMWAIINDYLANLINLEDRLMRRASTVSCNLSAKDHRNTKIRLNVHVT
ncbi:unnamed protein product [Nezara viridula]|uniref:Uncharacterized protein n=1 Tax=Nezara viridula TaxID=85310 RepID=A0A9P0HKT1_NEZVI|nr:unnamed protein product [Nezara viridula]